MRQPNAAAKTQILAVLRRGDPIITAKQPEQKIKPRNAYLFACSVFQSDEVVDVPETSNPLTDPARERATFFNVRAQMHAMHSYPSQLAKTTQITQDRITGFFWDVLTIQNFKVYRIVIRIKDSFLDELLQNQQQRTQDSYSDFMYNVAINDLVADITSCIPGKRLDSYNGQKAARHVLYLEPDCSLFNDESTGTLEELIETEQAAATLLHTSSSYLRPVLFQDMFIFPGLSFDNAKTSCVMLRFSPIEYEIKTPGYNEHKIPILPLSYISHCAITTISNFYTRELNSLSPNANEYWDIYKNWGNFAEYQTKFLSLRFKCETILLRAKEFIANCEANLRVTHFYDEEYIDFAKRDYGSETVAYTLSRDYGTVITAEKEKYEKNLERSIATTELRLKALEAFLKDAANADSANISLKLARGVGRLTWIVMALAILTLLMSFVPDKAKEQVYNLTMNSLCHRGVLSEEKICAPYLR